MLNYAHTASIAKFSDKQAPTLIFGQEPRNVKTRR